MSEELKKKDLEGSGRGLTELLVLSRQLSGGTGEKNYKSTLVHSVSGTEVPRETSRNASGNALNLYPEKMRFELRPEIFVILGFLHDCLDLLKSVGVYAVIQR
jgi:hypothetical protein